MSWLPHYRPHACAALVAASVVLWVSAAGESATCGDGDPRCLPAAVQAPAAAEELAGRYAPIVYLKDQDAPCDPNGEAFAPVPVEAMLGNENVTLRADPGDPGVPAPSAADLFEKGDAYYLDLPGNPTRPGCRFETDFRALAEELPNVTYARIATEEGERGIALQYWFFYYFNDWNNNHEGDWEMIQLVFDAESPEDALSVEPRLVAYSQHAAGERASWDDDKLAREGDRPIVYVAAGSHSNQFDQSNFVGRGEAAAGFGCDDASAPGTRIDPDVVLMPEAVDGRDDPFAWLTYAGRWGERRRSEFNGPTGPNMKASWASPISWADTRLRDSSIKVPGGRTAGPSPTNAFCATVTFASRQLLWVVAAAPWLVPIAGVAVVGAFGVTVRNTTFRAARDPLRRRRRFGQIMRTALQLYRTHFPLMLGIAAAFVPIGLIVSALQAVIFRLDIIDSILDLISTSRLADVAVALALGAGAFGLAYILVVAGVVAAIREIEANRPVSPLGAYTIVWHSLRALVRGRLVALAIVIGLAITVVGIPWAIRRAVDWLFIEEAIILDGASGRDAASASATAVQGSWWRTAAINLVLLTLGGVTSLVVVTPLLLFARDVPLDTVNTFSSIVYVIMAPFVALSLVLLYFDVRARSMASADSARD